MHLVAAKPRELEGDGGDALDLVGLVDLGVDGALLAVPQILDLLRLAEIDAAGQLAHDHDVEAVDAVALERGGVGERRVADGRTEIGEELEVLAQAQKAGLRALVVRDAVPFGAADRAEHHRIGGRCASHGRVRDRLPMRIVGAAADEVGLGLDLGVPSRIHPGDDAGDLGHHFGADAVAGEEQKFVCHALRASCVRGWPLPNGRRKC